MIKKQNIYTDVENQLGKNNAFCDYPGKMITVGTIAIALYWLTMMGMAVYSIHYHYHEYLCNLSGPSAICTSSSRQAYRQDASGILPDARYHLL
jgi:hypothetical protein